MHVYYDSLSEYQCMVLLLLISLNAAIYCGNLPKQVVENAM